ncbi:PREDICTED: uncharacterized protein LOC106746160 [Dinoponera quadriceps]|uniref:Uncharacterized protein LOC106746160 n=1 Tax=Dinoponera quadriceps TaxID=609295 RepID=A0A6P3XIV1_DINQU|nr:PREDICTED: uncharacterized protein LOC106746160 [Dinoponera quadriceps]
MSSYNLKDKEEVKEYLKNLHIEYQFGCYSEKKPEVCHLLGDYYEAINEDIKKAASLFKMNCDNYNYGRSCAKYGDFLAVGKGCKQNVPLAYEYMSKGCELNDENGCLHAGMLGTSNHDVGKKDRATQVQAGVEQLKKACDVYNSDTACFYLSGMYLAGKEGIINKNFKEAYKLSLKSCEFGNPYACANLSQMHARGDGVQKNDALAKTFKKRAIKLHEELKTIQTEVKFHQGVSSSRELLIIDYLISLSPSLRISPIVAFRPSHSRVFRCLPMPIGRNEFKSAFSPVYSLTSDTTMRYYLFNSRAWLVVAAFVALTCHSNLVNTQSQERNIVNVDVYYEALCGDSKRFITTQLAPSYGQLKDYIHITFIPYGKATHTRESTTTPWQFQCQHGPAECRGNKAQSCAINAIKSSENIENQEEMLVSLVNCAMSSRNPPTAVPQCAQNAGVSEETRSAIDNCIESSLGDDLLAENGDKTAALSPRLKFVPTIVINGVYSERNQNEALRNFPGLICRYLTESPAACSSSVN